ncbi:hypothetical protein KDA_18960 [Dictyobacter alpinus]|uniref:Uncharacterized protein n=1 Tax=Dictyobacter alpinus TaxID=2014873 RepID=A0A402B4Z7_9CHLR|nr:hypothetical protein [Dictyobacter alpinus]GCE26412.1 hypothetical protein KDA_18960 [Dictyobacter alpinus]
MPLNEYEGSLIPPPPDPNLYGAYENQEAASEPTTGPIPSAGQVSLQPEPRDNFLRRFVHSFEGFAFGYGRPGRTSQMPPPPRQPYDGGEKIKPDERSTIEKMRDKVAEFDEDYKDVGERVLGGFTQIIGYMGPFLLMAWIGSDLGKFFTPTMDAVPAYGLAFTIEGVIAACTVAMGRAFAEMASGKPNFGRMAMVILIWLVLNSSSAFGLYLVITHNNQIAQGSIEQLSMVIRVIAVALADLGCSAVLMFKGRSLQKHIESVRKRAAMIGELADAERSAKEADKNAELREQMMKSTLKIQEDLSKQIGEAVGMVMSSILEKMEKSLKEEDKNERGFGRR